MEVVHHGDQMKVAYNPNAGKSNTLTFDVTGTPVSPVPEPATMLLLGSGLLGLSGFRKKFKK